MQIDDIRFKRVFTYDHRERKLRLFRVMWEANGGPGPANQHRRGHSAKVSFNLVPKLFAFAHNQDTSDLRVVALGVQVHLHRSYGGRCE